MSGIGTVGELREALEQFDDDDVINVELKDNDETTTYDGGEVLVVSDVRPSPLTAGITLLAENLPD